MGSHKIYAATAGCFALFLSMSAAKAADLLPPPAPMPEPMVEFGGSWYLRGDVGVGIQDYRKTVGVNLTPGYPQTGYVERQKSLGDVVFVGAGVGYEFSSWLRFDVTGEYRGKTQWRYLEQDKNFFGNAYDLYNGRMSSVVGLANAYFDLGTWYGLTPFVGGGVGVAHHMFDNVADHGLGAYNGGFGIARKADKTDLAWALHAGVGYAVSSNLKLELAYRYLNMGDANAGIVGCAGAPGSCGPNPLRTSFKLRDIESHDLKIGMRWLLGAPTPVASYEPPPGPIIRKY